MNEYGPSAGGRIVGGLAVLLFGAIVLTLVVEIIRAILPWLIGIAVVGAVVALAVWRLKERNSRW